MPTIEHRTSSAGKEVYRAKVRVKGFTVQSASFKRLTDARRWAQGVEAAIRERRYFPCAEAKHHTVADLIDRYVREVLPAKPSDALNILRHLKWWRNALGLVSLAELTSSRLTVCRDQFQAEKKANGKLRAPATTVRYMASFSHALTVASKEWGWIEESPMRKVRRPKEAQGRVRYLSVDERTRLFEACKLSRNKALLPIVVLAISTGMRQAEIMCLCWNQVDRQRGRIILNKTKNGERRGVPMVGFAATLLAQQYEARRHDTNLLFPRADGKKPVLIPKAWGNAVRKAKLEDFRFHDLRHCAASYMAMQSASPSEIAALLGHKTLHMVKRYAHLSDTHMQRIVETMNARIFSDDAS